MTLGIFAKTFVRPNFAEAFRAAKSHGLDCVQFNFACAGLPTLPGRVDPPLLKRIQAALDGESLRMAAVSGTCNLIHPDPAQRAMDLEKLALLVRCCGELGTSVVTLCTGTRDPENMWRRHPENHDPAAWHDLARSLERLLPTAQECRVCLGVEPEPANVIDTARRARELLDQMRSPSLKIVFDEAEILAEAVDLLGEDIVVAHAKDLDQEGLIGEVAAGRGALNYGLYLSWLKRAGFKGPLILHNLRESEVAGAVGFLREKLQAAAAGQFAG
jgi:sugar phosphate isomerase/epimerase